MLFLLTIFSPTLGFFLFNFYRPKGRTLAGGVQIMEPAATNIVTTDSIRRFGGEFFSQMRWMRTKMWDSPPKKMVPRVVPLFGIAAPCPQDVCQISSWRFFHSRWNLLTHFSSCCRWGSQQLSLNLEVTNNEHQISLMPLEQQIFNQVVSEKPCLWSVIIGTYWIHWYVCVFVSPIVCQKWQRTRSHLFEQCGESPSYVVNVECYYYWWFRNPIPNHLGWC